MNAPTRYRGRFAPTPSGPLHAGSLVAALASWLDARAHRGQWFVRIEDADTPRCVPGADRLILSQLQTLGLHADAPPLWQSARGAAYRQALDRLLDAGWAYPCGCTRRDIDRALALAGRPRARHAELVYPGTCRNGLHGKPARAVRLRCSAADGSELWVHWTDRRLGPQRQNITREVGDFVLRRADDLWAYQLVVVVDDAMQGITQVVRGEDLADNTARQIHLQRLLGAGTPGYLHTPLVRDASGEKLSKRDSAASLDLRDSLQALRAAGTVLGLHVDAAHLDGWLAGAVAAWAARFGAGPG